MTIQRMFAAVALGMLLTSPRPAEAQYNFTTYDVPGAIYTSVNGINANGEISGITIDAHGRPVSSNGTENGNKESRQAFLPGLER